MIGVDMDATDIINQANQLMYLIITIAVIGLLAMIIVSRFLIKKVGDNTSEKYRYGFGQPCFR